MDLSAGELARINALEHGAQVTTPMVLQIVSNLQVLSSQAAGTPVRHRCIVSDSQQSMMAILPLHLSALTDEQKICRFTLLRVDKCSVTRKMRSNDGAMAAIIIMEAEVLGTVAEKIGNPEKVSFGPATAAAPGAGGAMSAPAVQQHAPPPPPPPPQQQQPWQQPQRQQQPMFGGSSFMSRVEEAKPAV
ncbi:Replication factor A protein 1, partial [Coemansia helicoidea]